MSFPCRKLEEVDAGPDGAEAWKFIAGDGEYVCELVFYNDIHHTEDRVKQLLK